MVRIFAHILATALLFLCIWHVGSAETLVWQDEFDTLDLSKWRHLVTAWGGGNQEFEYYRNDRKNSYVRNGILYLRPTLVADEYGENFLTSGSLTLPDCNMQPCTSSAGNDIVEPIFSARITSNFAFKYGRIEVRAQMPRGNWIWPAIWMLPRDSVYGGWPRSGEIDIVESKGNENYVDGSGQNVGNTLMGSTLHWGPDTAHNNWWRTHWEKNLQGTGQSFADGFHLFGMTWTDNHLIFTVDNVQIGDVWAPQNGFWYYGGFQDNPGGTNIWQNGNWMAPFDQEFQIIMNVAVGGTFFPDNVGNRPWSWNGRPMREFWDRRSEWLSTWNAEDAAMKIDYIRVYQD